jgi:hypothetical protein
MALEQIYLQITPPPRTELFLLPRRPRLGLLTGVNPFFFGDVVRRPLARLELTDRTVRCTLVTRNKLKREGWLADRLQIPDLAERVSAGNEVPVFEFPLGAYTIEWPKLSAGTVFEISDGSSEPWVVSFGKPEDFSRESWYTLPFTMSLYLKSPPRRQWRDMLTAKGRNA